MRVFNQTNYLMGLIRSFKGLASMIFEANTTRTKCLIILTPLNNNNNIALDTFSCSFNQNDLKKKK